MTLTTITPYWDRPEQLARWVENMKGCSHPEVQHFVYFVGEEQSPIELSRSDNSIYPFRFYDRPASIGHVHNRGAVDASTEWIMKLDVDCLPNLWFFTELLKVLETAGHKEWFNCGMINVNQHASEKFLSQPLTNDAYIEVMAHRRMYCAGHPNPHSTNFVCRRSDYLDLGGCDERFRGWGWEDYQQIYALEKHQQGRNPLPGKLDISNVARRCRDEISRRKALELFERSPWLCLLHHYHAPVLSKMDTSVHNLEVLFDYIKTHS